jgi:RNA polymerase sigma-70 factor (ECF subfamily)
VTATAATRQRVAAFLDSDYARVVGAVALATGDRERAEDAVQDAIVKTLSGDAEPENLRGWITVVAINFVKQAWRRANAQSSAYVRAVQFDDDLDLESQRTVNSLAVQEALEQLPERQRLAVTLHYLEGLSVAEVAATLEVSEGTIKTQLHRGRETLATAIGQEVA